MGGVERERWRTRDKGKGGLSDDSAPAFKNAGTPDNVWGSVCVNESACVCLSVCGVHARAYV